MAEITVEAPIGPLCLTAAGGAIVAAEWGRRAAAESDDPLLRAAAAQMADYFAGRRRAFDLPLRFAGPPFQRRVWALMQAIPYGTVRYYGDLGRDLGAAALAVGRACAGCDLAVLIPAHRVVGAGGRIGGWSGWGGIETKRWLLALEGWHPRR